MQEGTATRNADRSPERDTNRAEALNAVREVESYLQRAPTNNSSLRTSGNANMEMVNRRAPSANALRDGAEEPQDSFR